MSEAPAKKWRCLVCGYIHRGPAAPDECPICGASKDEFEEVCEETPAPAPKRWICGQCGRIESGAEPPEECVTCGAPRESFSLLEEKAPEAGAVAGKKRVVIVGAGIAGLSAAEAARAAAPEAEIILLSKEARLPYYRLNLTRYLAGEVPEDHLPLHPESWYREQRIDLRLGAEVSALDLAAKAVQIRGGQRLLFDALVLSGGAHAMVPPFPGVTREGVTAVRTLEDAQKLHAEARAGSRIVVIGGGILGLEAAVGLSRLGAKVTILEGGEWLLPRQLNERAGRLLARKVEEAGVELRGGVKVQALLGDERVRAVELASGVKIPADAVAICTGVRPNSFLAAAAGLQVKQGVVVDDLLATSHPAVFAAGDLAEHRGVLYGIWGPAQFQGQIAGRNAVGQKIEFGGVPRSNTLKVLNEPLFSLGQWQPEPGAQVVEGNVDGGYAYFVFRESRLTAAILLGSLLGSVGVKKAAEQRTDMAKVLALKPTASDLVATFARG
jgi:nitrite reductase (NADH) large subunit